METHLVQNFQLSRALCTYTHIHTGPCMQCHRPTSQYHWPSHHVEIGVVGFMSGYTHTQTTCTCTHTPCTCTHTPPHTHYTHNHHQHIQETHTQQIGTLLVWQDLTGFMNDTHTHTHARTHAHTRAYNVGKHTEASTNMHSKQALSHEICPFLWILKAKNLFLRASLSELWAHHLCRQFQS